MEFIPASKKTHKKPIIGVSPTDNHNNDVVLTKEINTKSETSAKPSAVAQNKALQDRFKKRIKVIFKNKKVDKSNADEIKTLHKDIIRVDFPRQRTRWCHIIFQNKKEAKQAFETLKENESVIVKYNNFDGTSPNTKKEEHKRKISKKKKVKDEEEQRISNWFN